MLTEAKASWPGRSQSFVLGQGVPGRLLRTTICFKLILSAEPHVSQGALVRRNSQVFSQHLRHRRPTPVIRFLRPQGIGNIPR